MQPKSPFQGIPPSVVNEELAAYSWLCQPAGMINRFCADHLDLRHAQFITQTVDSAMMAAFPGPGRKFFYIHDFSKATDYTSDARQELTEWGKIRQKQGCVELVVIIPPKGNTFFEMASNTAAMALRLVGMNVEIGRSVDDLVKRLELRTVK